MMHVRTMLHSLDAPVPMSLVALPFLLPGFHVDGTCLVGTTIIVDAHTMGASACCPQCQQRSTRVHSRYLRMPRDLPLSDYTVRLRLQVRRFLCCNPSCFQRTFAERLPQVVPFRAQRTVRFTRRVQALSFAVSAEAGARLATHLHTPVSPDTLLRIVRHTPLTPKATPHVLGVDEFALRKGKVYGTILVDLERRCPVDVLPDRTASTLAQWLRTHSGVQIIARDRSPEYARGARLGAPHARHVADRWHLLHNLREMVERVLTRRRAQLRRLPNASQVAVNNASAGRPRRLRLPTRSEQARQQEHRRRRYNQYAIVHDLLARGLSQRHVARLLGLSRTTVRVFAHADQFPERALRPPTASHIDPYLPYLQQRWRDGCHNGHQLWREIKQQGYPDGPRQVARWAQQQRTAPAPSTPNQYRHASRSLAPDGAEVQPPGTLVRLGEPRTLVWLLLRPVEALTPPEHQLLTYVLQDPHVAQVHHLAQQFQHMVRQRGAALLTSWLTASMASTVPDLRTFARSMQQDKDAVHAALVEDWSSGQVEGQVTRIKLIKRRMYGRAKFDLLRQHILYGD